MQMGKESRVPVLESERLILRAHTAKDLSECLALWNDPLVYRYISRQTSSETQCWSRLLSYRGLWELLGYGYWAVIEKASNRMVGELGFADFCREIHPSLQGIPEAGWVLKSEFHGLGYAREALDSALQWLDAQEFGSKSVCIIDKENEASLRLAAKLAYIFKEEAEFRGEIVQVYQRIRQS